MSRTSESARGKWRGVLLELGADRNTLSGKHGPCPFCQDGTDRFRWDNRAGSGSFICSQCGAGNGIEYVKRLLGCDFREAARRVDEVVGVVKPEPVKREASPADNRRRVLDLWRRGERITAGDPVSAYLAGRSVPMPQNTDCLRYVERCRAPDGSHHPAMIAKVAGPDGAGATLHRTFLAPGGEGKADLPHPRAVMPGEIPDGAAIRLAMHGSTLGIAEGIETALAAGKRFGVPTWAAINATMLEKWTPPEGVNDVWIFGDNDPAFGGAAAAYTLAHRLALKKLYVQVAIPIRVGCDWADADAA